MRNFECAELSSPCRRRRRRRRRRQSRAWQIEYARSISKNQPPPTDNDTERRERERPSSSHLIPIPRIHPPANSLVEFHISSAPAIQWKSVMFILKTFRRRKSWPGHSPVTLISKACNGRKRPLHAAASQPPVLEGSIRPL